MGSRLTLGLGFAAAVMAGLTLAGCGGGGGRSCPDDGLAVPDVSGRYVIEALGVSLSTCPASLNSLLDEAVAALDECPYEVRQNGAQLVTVGCEGGPRDACVDTQGVVTQLDSARQSQSGCTVRVDETFVAPLGTLPAFGTSTGRIRISGNCTVQTDCTAVIDFAVTRAVAAGSAARAAVPAQDSPIARLASRLASAAAR